MALNLRFVLLLAIVIGTPNIVVAQGYPVKAIRLVVPYPPGGGTDIIARIVGQKLTENLGQQIVIDNRGGAGGTIGTDIVAKSPADGYTILMAPTSHVINPSIYSCTVLLIPPHAQAMAAAVGALG